MDKFPVLNAKPSESEKWPEEVGQEVIEKLLKIALDDHQLREKGVVTINGVSASVTDFRSGFLFIEKEDVNEETWKIDVLFPVKASVVKFEHGSPTEKIPMYDLPAKLTRNHQFSNWFQSKSDRFKVVTAVPVLEDIFKAKGIEGVDVYNYAIETTYRTHKGLIPQATSIQVMPDNDNGSLAHIKKISDDQWEMTCYDSLITRRLPSSEQPKMNVVIYYVAVALIFMFIVVYMSFDRLYYFLYNFE